MAIRFTCAECASVLSIKDDLAGTAGRCPKCKTQFIVPDPQSKDEIAVERSRSTVEPENSTPTRETVSDRVTSSHSSPSRPKAVPVHEPAFSGGADRAPSGYNPDEVLRLDDSDGEIETPDTNPVDEHKPLPETTRVIGSADEEDLDCDPILVSHPMLSAKTVSAVTGGRQSDSPQLNLDGVPNTPSAAKSKSAATSFDPLRFLSADQQPVFDGPSSDHSLTNPLPRTPSPTPPETVPARSDRREVVPDLSLPFDSDPTPMDRTSSRPLNRPTPAVKATRPPAEKIDLATAAKMMKKAIKDSQAEEAHQRELEAKSGFDFGQVFREFGLKGLAILVGGIVMSFGLYYLADQMTSTRLKLPKMGYVKGVIKLDGKPLSGAMISFAPVENAIAGSKHERARTSIGVSDDNGQFQMMYVPPDGIAGVAAGVCRVWVTHIGPKGRNDVPPEWTEGAMLTREVTPGNQKAPFEINMQTPKR